jgi:hypothetical protein
LRPHSKASSSTKRKTSHFFRRSTPRSLGQQFLR